MPPVPQGAPACSAPRTSLAGFRAAAPRAPTCCSEQLFWGGAWLPKYDPEDYPRIRERMVDILVGGLATEGAAWVARAVWPNWPPARPGDEPRDLPAGGHPTDQPTRPPGRRRSGKISAELNVTKGSFYHHIDAKDDLVVACFDRTFEVMRRVQRLAMNLPGDQWLRLASAAAALAEYQLSEHGPLLRASALSALPAEISARNRSPIPTGSPTASPQ